MEGKWSPREGTWLFLSPHKDTGVSEGALCCHQLQPWPRRGAWPHLPCNAHLDTLAFPPFPDQMYPSWERKGLFTECHNIDANGSPGPSQSFLCFTGHNLLVSPGCRMQRGHRDGHPQHHWVDGLEGASGDRPVQGGVTR